MIDSQCHDNIICFSFMQFDLFSAKISINNASGVKIPSKYQLSPETSQWWKKWNVTVKMFTHVIQTYHKKPYPNVVKNLLL